MSFPYYPNPQDLKNESLQTQYDFLNLLRLRHLQWMTSAGDPQVEEVHLEIAELIEQITDQYQHLFSAIPHQPDSSQPAPVDAANGSSDRRTERTNAV
jgi:hypothetical protein